MSLVLGYASKEKAIIMSDGRAGGTVSPSETYNKTRKINNNIILGFVGYRETSEHFLNCANDDMGERISNCYIEEFLEEVEYGMNLNVTKEKLQSTFLIIGRTEKGSIRSAIIGNSTGYKLESRIISEPRFFSIGGTISGEIIKEIYTRNMQGMKLDIIGGMERTIKEVAALDYSINENVFCQNI